MSVNDAEHEPIRLPAIFQLGWFRWLPHAAMDIENILVRFPGIPRAELLLAQRVLHARQLGVTVDGGKEADALAAELPEAPAWSPPSLGEDDPDFEEERAEHDQRVREYDELIGRMGIGPVRTAAQTLDLMVRLGIVTVDDFGDGAKMWLASDPPLPTEVLPLSAEARAQEDQLRWTSRYGALSQKVLSLFIDEHTGGLRHTVLPTSLQRLAESTGADPEDVRHAVQVLIGEGDFTAHRQGVPVDVDRVIAHQRFDLVVDPVLFQRDRLSLTINRPIVRPDA